MTETKIQKLLFKKYGGHFSQLKHKLCISNIFLYDWESDFLSINKNDYVYEFEIKCSRFDYLNDFKKTEKHKSFKLLRNIPNYFYYIAPEGLINIKDIPEYAGLITINKIDSFWYSKKAPILHKDKFEQWEILAIKLFYNKFNL